MIGPHHAYEVIVGNIGRVHEGRNLRDANKHYAEYVAQSQSGRGRAGGEPVTLFRDDEIIREHVGSLSDWQDREGDD